MMEDQQGKRKKGERGSGKPAETSYVTATRKQGSKNAAKFWVPTPVCRELGVADGGTIEFHRHPLPSGGVEYVLRPVAKKDVFTGEQEGEFVEFCGKDILKSSIVKLALKSGLIEDILIEYDQQMKKDMADGRCQDGTVKRVMEYWKAFQGIE